jgi:5-methylcytosine-specific restriction endonuclease McrA
MAYRAKICRKCGGQYKPTSPNQKYCVQCGPAANRARAAKWVKANPDKRRASEAKYCKANPEKRKAKDLKWARENTIRKKTTDARRYAAHPERSKELNAKWYKENPEQARIKCATRRATKYGNTALDELLTSTEWLAILAQAGGHCHYCGKETNLTVDHVIPLSKGGKHSRDNVVAACLHCNDSKKDKTVEEWNAKKLAIQMRGNSEVAPNG